MTPEDIIAGTNTEQNQGSIGPLFVRSIGDLINEPESVVEYALPGIAMAGGKTLLHGGPKAGKSTLVFALLAEIARTGTIFGEPAEMDVPKTLILSEEPQTAIKERFNITRMPEDTPMDVHLYRDERPEVESPEHLADSIYKRYQLEQYNLLVIDTLGRWFSTPGQSFDDYGNTLDALYPIELLQRHAPHLAIILIHHSRKAGGDTIEAALGSTALPGQVDCIVSVNKVQNEPKQRRLSIESRYNVLPMWGDGQRLTLAFTNGAYTPAVVVNAWDMVKEALLTDTVNGLSQPEIVAYCKDVYGESGPAQGTVSKLLKEHDVLGVGSPKKFIYSYSNSGE